MFRLRPSAVVSSLVALLLVTGSLTSVRGQAPATPQGRGAVISQSLRDRAARDGRVRVIVQLRLDGSTAPEARLGSTQAILNRRQNIAGARARVLARLAAGTMRETRRYQTVPFVALEVGPGGLAALEGSPDIASVVPD